MALEHDLKKRRTPRELFLEKMDKLVPWERLERRIEPFYPKAGRGRRPYPLAADGGEVSRPEGPCHHHEHLIAILDRTPAYSCRPMSSYVVAYRQFL